MTYSISRTRMVHSGKTKEYSVVLVRAGEKCLQINRWGKLHNFGSIQGFPFSSYASAATQAKATIRSKAGRGYDIVQNVDKEYQSIEELYRALGPQYTKQLNPDHVAFLFPDADTSDVREAKPPEYEIVKGKWRRKEDPPKVLPDPEPTFEEAISLNPDWGLY